MNLIITKNSYKKCIIFQYILVLILLLNLFLIHHFILGLFFSSIFFISQILLLSLHFHSEEENRINSIFLGFLWILSEIIILGTLTYYIYQLNNIAIAFILIVITLINSRQINFKKLILFKNKQINTKGFILSLFYFLGLVMCIKSIHLNQTVSTLRSPWEVLDLQFFLSYLFTTLILITLFYKKSSQKLLLFLSVIHLFLSSSIALFIYRIGFGFDPFIHRATEQYIYDKGQILPKPFYYIGQYALITFLSKISLISIPTLDRILVPMLFSLTPIGIYSIVKRFEMNTKLNLPKIAYISPLLIPFGSFIMTTPYNLAVVLFFFSLLLSIDFLIQKKRYTLFLQISLSISSFLIHPLAGIPTLILSLFLCLKYFSKSRIFIYLIPILCFALPTLFIFNGFLNHSLHETLNPSWKQNLLSIFSNHIPKIEWTNNFHLLYDMLYFWGQNILIIYLLLALVGYYALIHTVLKKTLNILGICFLIFFLNSIFIQTFIAFPGVIDYEQSDYGNRIFYLSFYLLLPFAAIALTLLFQSKTKNKILYPFWILILSSLITTNLFFSYPRHNKFETGHGYSVSQSDIKAVHKIESEHESEYIVLSNQIVAAAALKEFGFKRYYLQRSPPSNDQHYFYSIPTGGPLYKEYLNMVYESPSRKYIQKAAQLVGVNEAFLVINDYWSDFEKIIQNAKFQADHTYIIDNGQIYIFHFKQL